MSKLFNLVSVMIHFLDSLVRLSHHRTYGSRIRRFIIHHSNRSFHRLELSPTFILGYMAAGKLSVSPPCSQLNFKEDNVQPFLRI